jgi:hypothetical protein
MNSGAGNYLRMSWLGHNSGSICPQGTVVKGPVLVPKIEDPQYLYACGISAFESSFTNQSDVNAFQAEKSRYSFMYFDRSIDDPFIQGLKAKFHMKTTPLQKNWYRINFNSD